MSVISTAECMRVDGVHGRREREESGEGEKERVKRKAHCSPCITGRLEKDAGKNQPKARLLYFRAVERSFGPNTHPPESSGKDPRQVLSNLARDLP